MNTLVFIEAGKNRLASSEIESGGVPRVGDRVVIDGRSLHVVEVAWDVDMGQVRVTVERKDSYANVEG